MIRITSDIASLDLYYVHGFLSETYWAKGRTLNEMQTIVQNSLNFSVLLNERQIGYARVVTDYVQFAYLMDVFIDPLFQGKGYAKELVRHVLSHTDLQHIKVWRLATQDAHGLYEQFGFGPIAKPENMMERITGSL